jgi:hypothetical protein
MKLRVPYWATDGFDIRLNGVSVSSSYKPSSYVTIPARDWSEADILEVTMPFTRHIDYGPDKVETAFAGQNQPDNQFAPMWAGTLMYGPLAMTTTGVNSWDEAVLTLDSYLETIITNAPGGGSAGTNGNLYTLTVGDKTFEPDYYRDEHSTHYFRIAVADDMISGFREMLSNKMEDAGVFRTENYTPVSYKKLKEALVAGIKLISTEKITQREIIDRIAAIDSAVLQLQPTGLDKSDLTAVISQATSVNAADYTWDTYHVLQMKLVTAREMEVTSVSQLSVDRQTVTLHNALRDLMPAGSVDKSYLGEMLALAIERKAMQEAWNALTVKIPEYSPWAPHAYRRLLYHLGEAEKIYENREKNNSQNEVNMAAAALNAAINTMRPGNLPEPEDLYPLSTLLRKADRVISTERMPQLTEAVTFARMVVTYVNEGSGTHDMIRNATGRLREALN